MSEELVRYEARGAVALISLVLEGSVIVPELATRVSGTLP